MSSKPLKTQPLAAAILTLLALSPAAAQEPADGRGHERELETVTVTATPLGEEELVEPATVLAGPELEDRRAATLGETVSNEAGVQSSSFGPGVGRPIIRGLEGARVQVLSGGLGALDVSTVSVDHPVTIEPFLAEQIEILKGPATLLYGSGAIGGVVNVVDGRIPERLDEGLHGRAELRTNTVSGEATGMARADFASERDALHADFVSRHADDYETGDGDTLDNSAVSTTSAALGYTRFGDFGPAGLAVSRYDTRYGVPGGHAHDDEEHADEAPGEEEGHEDVEIDAGQTRLDAKLQLDAPFAAAERIVLRGARNDYDHVELEGGAIGTRFESRASELRGELVHVPFGAWSGAFGVQTTRRDFEAIGAEAFVPPSRTDDFGLFALERADAGAFTFELGARHDEVSVETDDGRRASFGATSLSGGAIWHASDAFDLHLNLDRAQRAPTSEELHSNGPHLATRGFEIGDASLDVETAKSVELGVHVETGRLTARVAVYRTRFDDFIFLADTREIDPDAELPVRRWMQRDATHRGAEAELELELADGPSGRWDLRVFGDTVDATLDDGTPLPRIAPSRAGVKLAWARDGWRAHVGAVRHATQDEVAPEESPTPGYTLVSAHVSRAFALAGGRELELFLDATNLADADAHVHTSFLKDEAPLPGRAFALGLRAWW